MRIVEAKRDSVRLSRVPAGAVFDVPGYAGPYIRTDQSGGKHSAVNLRHGTMLNLADSIQVVPRDAVLTLEV